MAQPIITPEAVVLDLERASVASRTLAMVVDGLALALTWVVLALVTTQLAGTSEGAAAVWYVLLSLTLVFAWFCGFETLWRGRTPGKAALGLRVVSVDGTPIRFQQAFLRATAGLVDFALVPIAFVAVVTVLLSPRDQRLGDMAAGTLVVRERSARSLVAPAWFPPPPGYEAYVASLDVTALGEDAYALLRSFLLRSPELTLGARDHLATRLANPIAVRLGHTPPPHVHPHAFLICVAARWQQSHGMQPPTHYAPPPPMGPPRPPPPAPGSMPAPAGPLPVGLTPPPPPAPPPPSPSRPPPPRPPPPPASTPPAGPPLRS